MCLVLLGWRAHPDYRLIVAANRDEFYTRPTEAMRRWPEIPGLLAGRDLGVVGAANDNVPGTWLGLHTESGRFGAVTNVRNPADERTGVRSRGALLLDFLVGSTTNSPHSYVREVAESAVDYNGYNVLVSDLQSLWWRSNRADEPAREVEPGFHGLSNAATLGSSDTAGTMLAGPRRIWPKVGSGVLALRSVVQAEPESLDRYFDVLADRTPAPDASLPETGVSMEMERAVSSRFVAHTEHGTRCSTVLLVREDGTYEVQERSFGQLGEPHGTVALRGTLPPLPS